jgi:hypothetical protein
MIAGPNGEQAGTGTCTQPAQSDEEFREADRTTAPCASGWYYIVPASYTNLTLNVKGGLGESRSIITYPISCVNNSIWYYSGA